MGLGPSTKMTTLFHFNCPVVQTLLATPQVTLPAVIIAGISEDYQQKLFVAQRVGDLLHQLQVAGVIVITDGWGNHHIDFVEALVAGAKAGITTVGLSFFGLQGRLVYTSPDLETLLDFNKGVTGYESCVVGGNALMPLDAYKAVKLLTYRLSQRSPGPQINSGVMAQRQLTRCYYAIDQVHFGTRTEIKARTLTLQAEPPSIAAFEQWLAGVKVALIPPGARQQFVNSNLDFSPIACKQTGALGTGTTAVLTGVTVMLTGVEPETGIQPANIGSSEGILAQQVQFDTPGTPLTTDWLLHLDFQFKPGQARERAGIHAAHQVADRYVDRIRAVLQALTRPTTVEQFTEHGAGADQRIAVVKLVSGLGAMYDTLVFPQAPGGCQGGHSVMAFDNLPLAVSPLQILDGVLHSLL